MATTKRPATTKRRNQGKREWDAIKIRLTPEEKAYVTARADRELRSVQECIRFLIREAKEAEAA